MGRDSEGSADPAGVTRARSLSLVRDDVDVIAEVAGAQSESPQGPMVGPAWTSARALAGDYHAAVEDLAAPDSPRFAARDGAGQAGQARRAVTAELLGHL